MANTRSFIVCGSGNKLFALFRTVIYFITERNLSLFEDKLVEQFKVVETIKVLGRRETEQEDNPFAIEQLKLQGKIKEDLTSSRRILHSLNKMENILMEIELTLQGMDGMCDEKVSDQKLTDQNLYTLEDIVNVDSNYNLGVKSVACVPEEQEEHNNASLDQTEYLQFMSTVNLAYPNHRSDIVQSLLTAIQKDLKDIPIHGRNLALRAHLAGHQDRLKRSRGSALQKAVLEFQQCMCRNEGPNGNQDQPVGLNEPMEIGVSKDVILKKQESEKDVRKDDQPEEKCPEEVCPERDSWSKEVEKSKLEMALEELYDKIDIGFESKSKKLEERIRDMLEASFDPLYLTNFNKCNEVPPDTRGHEKTLSVLQNLQRDFTRHQEDVQRWRMQEECNGDLASEEINMYRLEKENEKILRQLEEKEEILLELEEEKAEILRELEEEREHSKEQINKMAEERVEMNNLKEQNRIQMEENEKILRKLEEEKEEILLELEEERERSKEQINKMAEERVEMHNLKEQNRIQMEENEKILRKLEEEKAEILRQLEEEREHSKEQINKMAEERVKMNDLKEQNRIQMEENEKILRKLEEEKAEILRQLEEEREHSKEQINKMAEERVKMNDLKEQNRIQMEENEKILRKLEEEKAEILLELEEEREHSKEQINKMAEERVKMNDLKEQNRIQMEENEKILRKLEEEKAEILLELEEERERSKEQISKMAEEIVEISRLKKENEVHLEEKEKILRKLEEEKGKILRELVEEGEHSKEKKGQTKEERKMNRLKRVNEILLEDRQNIIHELEVEREHMRDKVGEIRQLKDELFMKECELMETRSELGCWIVELLEEEGLIDDVNRREGQLRDMVETIRGSNECLTNKLDKQHDPNTKIENIGEDLLKLESILLEETEDHRKPTDQNLEDTFEVESVAYVPEETKEQHYDTNSSGTERVHFLGTEKHSHLDLRSNIVQDLLNGIQNRLREIPIEQKNMPLRAHLAGHQVLLKRARGSALQKAVLQFQQCWCPNERPKSKQKQPTGPNEPKEIEFLEEKKEYVAMEAFHNKMDAKVTYEINRVEERTQDMINARMETFRRKIEEELLVHPTSYKNFSNEVPADEEGQEKLLSIAQNLQRDFSHYMEDIQRWQLQRRSKGDLRSEEKVEISRLKKENEVHLEEKEKILRELEEKEKILRELEEKEKILRELEEEREHSKEQINKMAEEKVINNLKEQNRIQMEEKEKILRELEEKEKILRQLEEEREHSKEQINKMAEEKVINNLKEQNRIQMEEKEKILRELEEKEKILRQLEEEREHSKEQINKMAEEKVINNLKEQNRIQMEEKEKILRELEEKEKILRQLEEEREHSKEQINKMAEEKVIKKKESTVKSK
ncbi:trichohyalin-like [Palaemon carinicauda]|uniref:trichohyalin-like n=1 Tax=Palaemon carinicauda TaxID=392227 RepID=UPI0035B5BEBC